MLCCILGHAGVVQWQNSSFPSWERGFDSHHPLHAGNLLLGTYRKTPTREAAVCRHTIECAHVAQSAEHRHGKAVVTGSNPVMGSIKKCQVLLVMLT